MAFLALLQASFFLHFPILDFYSALLRLGVSSRHSFGLDFTDWVFFFFFVLKLNFYLGFNG